MELDLTAAEREAIRARCDDAVRNSKAFFKDAEPVAFARRRCRLTTP
jgi:hypothetical protein